MVYSFLTHNHKASFTSFKEDPYDANVTVTESVKDLDLRIKMIIFRSLLITFETRLIFRGSRDSSENHLVPKAKTPSFTKDAITSLTKISLSKAVKRSVQSSYI